MLILLGMAAALLVAVFIHELGHAVAGKLLGFRLASFAVWPVCLNRAMGSGRVSFSFRFAVKPLGFVSSYPVSSLHLKTGLMAQIACGPFASAATALLAPLATAWLEPVNQEIAAFVGGIGFWSVLMTIMAPVPARVGAFKTDALQIWELARGNQTILRSHAMYSLASSYRDLRPREWDAGLVQLALDNSIPVDRTPNLESSLQHLRYQHCADTGDTAQAGEALSWILRQELKPRDRFAWQWESVWFQAFSLCNPLAAREQLQIAEALPPVADLELHVWKARAAIAAREGRPDEARSAAAKARLCSASQRAFPASMARAIEGDLDDLLHQASSTLSSSLPAPPAAASGSLLRYS